MTSLASAFGELTVSQGDWVSWLVLCEKGDPRIEVAWDFVLEHCPDNVRTAVPGRRVVNIPYTRAHPYKRAVRDDNYSFEFELHVYIDEPLATRQRLRWPNPSEWTVGK